MFTIRDVAKILDISEMSVRQLLHKNRIQANKVKRGNIEVWMISQQAIDDYVSTRRQRNVKQYIVTLTSEQYEQFVNQGFEIRPRFVKNDEEVNEQ